jgi:haloalkane dehalogenase
MAAESLHPRAAADDRPAWLGDDVWPYRVHRLRTAAHDIAYTDTGTGPPLLLVHIGMWSFLWRDLIGELRPHFRCVTLDAPGTGLIPEPLRKGAELDGAADAVTALVEALDLTDLTLVVHDLGGPAAVAASASWPQRVRGLVAVNTFAWQPDGRLLPLALRLMGSVPVRVFDSATRALPALTSTSFGVGRHLDGAARRAFRAGVRPAAFHSYVRATRRRPFFAHVEAALAQLADRPLLTVFGERNDPGKFQPRWQALFPAAEQVIVAKGNHFPMCDNPAFVAEAIRRFHAERLPAAGGTEERAPGQIGGQG